MFTPSSPRQHRAAFSLYAGLVLGTPLVCTAQDTAAEAASSVNPPVSTATDSAQTLAPISVISQRIQRSRNTLSPTTGSSQYSFDKQSLQRLPAGNNTPLNRVLLQAPGVVANSQGQLHVRGDHANLQYRINGVILPESLSTLGQVLSPRFAGSINLITGALPAQFGERTAGIIDITTRKDVNGGDVGVFGGSFGTVEPSFAVGHTTAGATTAFLGGSYLHSRLGTAPATADYNPIHDATERGRGFGFVSTPLGHSLRLSVMAGALYHRFEIPNLLGQPANPVYERFAGMTAPASRDLNARQYLRNKFGIVSLQGALGQQGKWQIAAFGRFGSVDYTPDPRLGDLLYNGVSARIKRHNISWGLQGDASLPLGLYHTLRFGFVARDENNRINNTSAIFPTVETVNGSCPAGSANAGGAEPQCINGGPQSIVNNTAHIGNTLEAVYMQDQWDIAERVTLNYGLRFDQLNGVVSSNQLSPRIGVVWYVDDATTFHAGYARYFTPPPNQLLPSSSLIAFHNTTNAPPSLKNTPVEPERAHYFDIGATHQLTPALNIGVDSYYKYARNLLDEGQFGNALIYTPFNLDRGHVYGVELSTAFHNGNWDAYLNVSRSMAKATGVTSAQFNLDPEALAYINNHYVYLDHTQLWTVSAGLSYRWRQTLLLLDGNYQDGLRNDGANDIPNSGKQPPHVVLNAAVVQSFNWGGPGPFRVRLAALNLLDRSYQIHDGTGIGVNRPEYGARRGIYIGLNQSF